MSQASTIPRWDLVKNGQTLVSFGSFIEMDRTHDATVTEQPIEKGSFNSVNKVTSPVTFTVQLALVGTDAEITEAVNVLSEELLDTSLLQIINPLGATPEATLTKYSFKQSVENGYARLVVSLTMQEIKQIESTYTLSFGSSGASTNGASPIAQGQAKNASDVSNQDTGKAQAQEASGSILSQLFG